MPWSGTEPPCRCEAAAPDRPWQVAKIPTCVGWGPTKTIAKLANGIAKDHAKLGGLCDLRDAAARAGWYARLPVDEVWGIGRRTTEKLKASGVETIADFLALDARAVRDRLTVVGARVQAELHGISCLPLQMLAATRKGLACTRAFSRPVTAWPDMREAVAAYAARAAEKLRAERLEACHLTVFLHTNPHEWAPQYSASRACRIEPSSDTRDLISEAVRLLEPLWREGYRYAKCGVILNDLVPAGEQRRLFPTRSPRASAKTMAVLDAINRRHGRGTLQVASTGLARSWATRAQRLSPRYTTRLEDILAVTAF